MIVHLEHSIDGYPLCWPMDRDGPFDATRDEHAITCDDCLTILDADDDPEAVSA